MTEATKPDIQERYITARNGSDVVTAAGMVSQRHEIALMLWGVTFEGKTGQKIELADKLGSLLNSRMARDRSLKGDAWKIATEMLAWHLHGVCETCDGRGYEAIQGTPSLFDRPCHHCHGTGKRSHPREASHIWLAGEMSRLTHMAAGEMMKRLRVSMEL